MAVCAGRVPLTRNLLAVAKTVGRPRRLAGCVACTVLDLLMLMFPGGRERTEAEWRSLLNKAGFVITKIMSTRVADSVIEAVLD